MFETSTFMPHGHCYLWRPDILWLNVVSDGLIALAYFSIPVALIYFVRKRSDLKYKWMFYLFAVFITSCGVTHLGSLYTTWVPYYGWHGLIKSFTAVASVATAVLLWPLIPQALRLPSPQDLERKNRELKSLTATLEEKVAEKVKDSKRLATIVNQSQDAILSKDLNGKVTSWNKAAENIFQFTAEEIIGESIHKIIPEEGIEQYEGLIQQIYQGKRLEPFEAIRKRKDGTEVPVHITLSPIRDEDGKVVAASAVSKDLTQRKILDKKLEKTTQELEERNKQLININRAKDEFIANLSHELRSPLNVILGYSEMLSEHPVSSTMFKSAIEFIQKHAQIQLHLVEDLLDMSQIVAGKFSLKIGTHDVEQIVDKAINTIKHAAHAKNITITKQIEVSRRTIVCDAGRMHQVLWNLLSNAVKYSDEGGEITVRAQREASGNCIFEVSDTGQGIADEDIPHLFDRFWQTRPSDRGQVGGLGLGLNIAKDLVEAHGGKITARSPGPGKGATFQVSLPIKAVEQDGSSIEFEEPNKPLSGLCVLLVDDSPDALEMVRIVLENAGAKVVTAFNGAEALNIIRENGVEIIVSDINMPVMDGYSFMEQTRNVELEKGSSLRPAIALTARDGVGEKELAHKSGYHLHLVKPVPPKMLVAEIASIWKKQMRAEG